MKFNPQQQLAVNHISNPAMVVASAGSGKSTVLIGRIENLVNNHKIPQENILAISFTRNTADELKAKLKSKDMEYVTVGTFHYMCARILSLNNYNVQNIIKPWQSKKCFENALGQDTKIDEKEILSFIGYQKNHMKTYEDNFAQKNISKKYSEIDMRKCFKEYEIYKKKMGLCDLDDYLPMCYEFLKNNKNHAYKWEYLLIDEFQDTNTIQYLLAKEWSANNNIMAIGDVKQAIYGFRGAVPELFMNFHNKNENTTVINLDTNYRSCDNIVKNSNRFIKKYYGSYVHYSDSIAHNKKDGTIERYSFNDRKEESISIVDNIELMIKEGSKLKDISILYRNNSHADYIECELKDRNIPYIISKDSSFFKRKEISAIMCYLRLILNSHDDGAFEEIYKFRSYPLNFFSDKILSDIKSESGKRNISLYESFLDFKYDKTWLKTNVKIFDDSIRRLKLQKEKQCDIISLIDNIKRVFKFEDYIDSKYTNSEEANERLDSIETLKKFIKGDNLNNFIDYVYSEDKNKDKNKNNKDAISLMTVHASKGLEFDNVFLVGVEDGKFPSEKSDLLEEVRLFYVATTRPKTNLLISEIGYGNQFVDEYFGE